MRGNALPGFQLSRFFSAESLHVGRVATRQTLTFFDTTAHALVATLVYKEANITPVLTSDLMNCGLFDNATRLHRQVSCMKAFCRNELTILQNLQVEPAVGILQSSR